MSRKERDEAAAKAFVLRGEIAPGYEARSDEVYGEIELVRIAQSDEGPCIVVVARRTADEFSNEKEEA